MKGKENNLIRKNAVYMMLGLILLTGCSQNNDASDQAANTQKGMDSESVEVWSQAMLSAFSGENSYFTADQEERDGQVCPKLRGEAFDVVISESSLEIEGKETGKIAQIAIENIEDIIMGGTVSFYVEDVNQDTKKDLIIDYYEGGTDVKNESLLVLDGASLEEISVEADMNFLEESIASYDETMSAYAAWSGIHYDQETGEIYEFLEANYGEPTKVAGEMRCSFLYDEANAKFILNKESLEFK